MVSLQIEKIGDDCEGCEGYARQGPFLLTLALRERRPSKVAG